MAGSPSAVVAVAPECTTYRKRAGPWIVLLLFVALRVGMDLHWHRLDNGLPDGDESGHLGAIELYRDITGDQGAAVAVTTGWRSTSEYPPLYPLVNGILLSWLRVDGPFPRGVSALLAFWMGATLIAVAWMTARAEQYAWGRHDRALAWRAGRHRASWAGVSWAGVLAAAAYGTFPLPAALGRHAMLEPFLAMWVALSLGLAFTTRQFTRSLPSALLGLSVALGFLTKQTFILYVAGPLALLLLDSVAARGVRTLPRMAVALACALPLPLAWLGEHWDAQSAYGLASAAAKADVGPLLHLVYYPAVLAGLGLGAGWILPTLIAVSTLVARKRWRLVATLVLVLGTLVLVPKKYPRLIVPALPLVAAVTALGLLCVPAAAWRRMAAGAAVGAGLLQQACVTLPIAGAPTRCGLWRPGFFHLVDPGCPQRWIEPPRRDDLGFDELLGEIREIPVRHRSGRWLGMVEEPGIPCRYETTFHYAYHLAGYLRRHGVPLDSIPVYARDPEAFLAAADAFGMVVSSRPWCPDGEGVVVPPEDWTPPSMAWRVAPLRNTGPPVNQRSTSTASESRETGPVPSSDRWASSEPDGFRRSRRLCEVRKDFVLEAVLTFKDQPLELALYVYRRLPSEPSKP